MSRFVNPSWAFPWAARRVRLAAKLLGAGERPLSASWDEVAAMTPRFETARNVSKEPLAGPEKLFGSTRPWSR